MGEIIKFPTTAREERVTQKLLAISAEIDQIILNAMRDPEIEPTELSGLLSHRLGSLLRHIEDKEQLWEVCARLLKKQAHIE